MPGNDSKCLGINYDFVALTRCWKNSRGKIYPLISSGNRTHVEIQAGDSITTLNTVNYDCPFQLTLYLSSKS